MMANFTETVLWDGSVMGVDQVGPFHGQQEVREFLAGILETQTAQRRHSFTNVVVDRLDGDEATAHAYLLLWSSEQGRTTPITTGPYRFTFTRMGGEWLISAVLAGWDAPLDWQR